MKRICIFAVWMMLVLTGCGAPVAGLLGTPEVVYSASPAATATATVSPTPTVGWQATAVAAQATADEAMRIDTASTAAEKERVQVQLGWTAQADMWTAQSSDATATAYGTSVPLTSTARSEDLTAMAGQQTLTAGELTAVKEAPTQAVAMIRTENERKYGWVNYAALAALAFGMFGVGVFALAKAGGGNKPMVTYQQTAEIEALTDVAPTQVVADPIRREDLVPLMDNDEPRVLVVVRRENPEGGHGEERFYVPCDRDQLYELAVRVLDDGATLAINNWEGEGTALTRKVIERLRGYFQEKKLVTSLGAGRLNFNERGLALLYAVRGKKPLPSSGVTVDGGDLPFSMSHDMGAHVVAHGGGG